MKGLFCYLLGHKLKFAYAWNQWGRKIKQGEICIRFGCYHIQKFYVPQTFYEKILGEKS